MLEILQYDFIQNAIIAGVLISIAAGVIGSLVVVNKITFLTGGIAHSAYGGIGIAIFLGIPVLFGATVFAILTAILIAIITLKNRSRVDAIIGMMWASGMAIGIVFIDLTPGYNVDLMSYLFGSIIAVSLSDLYYMIALDIFIIAIIAIFYKEILAVSYDSEFAYLRGINVKFFYTLILILSALCVVAAIKAVGLILVIALLTIPTYLAEAFSNKLSTMMILSSVLATIFTLSGLAISYLYDISSGASIVMISVVALAIVKILKK
ncbi:MULTISPECIES: metal ABC transporter permease [Arcobacteraceae]|uniref:High-affinity zinc uptake system membrane protein ZnuB n=2 Tax=Aliarcobacter thereius TaxID=544718 RepID=A0A1C0B7Z1_9BACT|nr:MULTISPECIES: iron chelate uptake ABC transporter family permease subunit [Arcobacteraceae]OCL87762.1 High-affinity zinc uptake system membrane protein ZnuB [Aliarcobacter thereius]OCL87937.1 High-affinity zinc uptake system membrane protein ZnuB [Arcobacter porcinus]OCL94019.1 High-affinity zinc uptake system membrane protein ZnuB [Aliarcobacter thereius]OCL95413.1 High-affinity zinc uptake system membrane protein ZnuB [Aliarcobacter thereius LMG 24486]OCL99693.1 High-affinity zinc uptake 